MEHEVKVKRWKGKFHTAEYMTWPQMTKWERAVDAARELGDKANTSDFYGTLLPTALEIITKTEIKGLPEHLTLETFPSSAMLCVAVVEAITSLYQLTNQDEELPKAPEPS